MQSYKTFLKPGSLTLIIYLNGLLSDSSVGQPDPRKYVMKNLREMKLHSFGVLTNIDL